MGLTESQWRSLQVRSVDPFSSYFSDNVNRHTRIVSGGVDCIVTGLRATIDETDRRKCTIGAGICIKDDMMIQFTSSVVIDLTDELFYVDNNPVSTAGVLYIVLVYKYQKIKPPPVAKILLCRPDQYDPSAHLFLQAITVDFYQNIDSYGFVHVYDYDPNLQSIHRVYPLFIGQLKGIPNGFASLDENGHIPPEQLWIDDTCTNARVLWSSYKISQELESLEHKALTTSLTSEYDEYQDWLEHSIFKFLTCDSFLTDDLIDIDNTNALVDLTNRQIVGSAGDQFQTKRLNETDDMINACALALHGNGQIVAYASVDGGTTWEQLSLSENNISRNHVFSQPGNDLRIKFTFLTDGVIYKYGVLFGIDTSAIVLNTIDASNMVSWTPPVTTLVSNSSLELNRVSIPPGKIIHIRRVILSRLDGDLTPDTQLQIVNVDTDDVIYSVHNEWWEGDVVLGPSQQISFRLVNLSDETVELSATINGIISNI